MFELIFLFLSELFLVQNFHFVWLTHFQSIYVAFRQRTQQDFGVALLYLIRIEERQVSDFVVDKKCSERISIEGVLCFDQPRSFVKTLCILTHHVNFITDRSMAFEDQELQVKTSP